MKYNIFLYGLVAAMISSCSSAYKASQTPDDVYYSPARQGVHKETAKNDRYEDYVSSQEDQYLRMKVMNRERWSSLDDYSYWNDSRYVPYSNFNYDFYRNNMFYDSYAWNNWNSPYYNFYYNPFYAGGYNMSGYFYPQYGFGYNSYGPTYIVKNPTRALSPSVNRPNLNGYRNGLYNNRNYNNNNYNRQGFGNSLRKAFSPNNNSYNYSNRNSNTNTYSSPERSYSPSSNSSSSNSSSRSSGGSSGGVSRPPR